MSDSNEFGDPLPTYFDLECEIARQRTRARQLEIVLTGPGPDLLAEDLEIVTGCAAAHPDRRGGQHVAMQCTGVLIVHRPTGIASRCVDERSQIKNRQKALAQLRRLVGWNKLAAEGVLAP